MPNYFNEELPSAPSMFGAAWQVSPINPKNIIKGLDALNGPEGPAGAALPIGVKQAVPQMFDFIPPAALPAMKTTTMQGGGRMPPFVGPPAPPMPWHAGLLQRTDGPALPPDVQAVVNQNVAAAQAGNPMPLFQNAAPPTPQEQIIDVGGQRTVTPFSSFGQTPGGMTIYQPPAGASPVIPTQTPLDVQMGNLADNMPSLFGSRFGRAQLASELANAMAAKNVQAERLGFERERQAERLAFEREREARLAREDELQWTPERLEIGARARALPYIMAGLHEEGPGRVTDFMREGLGGFLTGKKSDETAFGPPPSNKFVNRVLMRATEGKGGELNLGNVVQALRGVRADLVRTNPAAAKTLTNDVVAQLASMSGGPQALEKQLQDLSNRLDVRGIRMQPAIRTGFFGLGLPGSYEDYAETLPQLLEATRNLPR